MSAFCGSCREAVLSIVKTEAAAVYVGCVVKVRESFIIRLSLACFLLLALSTDRAWMKFAKVDRILAGLSGR